MPQNFLNSGPYAGLTSAVQDTQVQAGRFSGLRSRFMADTENTQPERRRLGGQASLQAANSMAEGAAPTFAGSLSNALRVAKVRQGINAKGEEAIRHQQLRDRIAIARMGISTRARGLSSLSNAAYIREGGDVANQQAKDFARASNADLLGSVLGAGAAWYKNRDPNSDLQPIDLSTLPGYR